MLKKTKIVSTLGPSSNNSKTLKKMIKKGVNVFRFNFSHGTHSTHSENLELVKDASKTLNTVVGTLQDICGPKVRVLAFENDSITLKEGDFLYLSKEENDISSTNGESFEDGRKIYLNNPKVLKNVQVNEKVYFADGAIHTETVEVTNSYIKLLIKNKSVLKSNKGVNFPNTFIDIDVLTEKDIIDIEWGIKNEVSFIAISFVQNANDILKAKKIISEFMVKHNKTYPPKIIAKIEKFDAVENIDEILEVTDGIMVARGDLGIEIPYYKVPIVQKNIIKKSNLLGKPVIVATQMMLSMVDNEMATRAEISDVSNAVLDGADALMLSEESAVGKHPAKVVEALTNTIRETELNMYNFAGIHNIDDDVEAVTHGAVNIAHGMKCNAIINFTSAGNTTRKISKYKPSMPIYSIAHHKYIARQLTLSWGVEVIDVYKKDETHSLIVKFIKNGIDSGLLSYEGKYLVTAGYPSGIEGNINFIRTLSKNDIEFFYNQGV